MRNEDSGIALQSGQVSVAPTRAAALPFVPAKAAPPLTAQPTHRLDPDSLAATTDTPQKRPPFHCFACAIKNS